LKTEQLKEIGDESWADEGFSLPSARKLSWLMKIVFINSLF
jgi:hypothetical protein